VRFFVLSNGFPTIFINSSCGLREEDPLPPLLFVDIMEALSIDAAAIVDRGLLLGFSMGSRNNDKLLWLIFFFQRIL
jgi:hypothetical protein